MPRGFVDETSALRAGKKSYDACFTILIASSVLLCGDSCVLLSVECRGLVSCSERVACLPIACPDPESEF